MVSGRKTFDLKKRDMEVLGIVPARAGSKRIPGKNILPLVAKPLIAWTIEAALATSTISRLIVSTDGDEIAEVATAYGAEVPFMRPDIIAQDQTPDLPVCQHALAWLSEHQDYKPDIVVWLRPTTPLRTTQDIESAVQLLIESQADCVRSVCSVEHHPYWMKKMHGNYLESFIAGYDESTYYQRQMLPPLYRLNGAVDVVWRISIPNAGSMLFTGRMCGYVMPAERSVDLDTELDYLWLQTVLGRKNAYSAN